MPMLAVTKMSLPLMQNGTASDSPMRCGHVLGVAAAPRAGWRTRRRPAGPRCRRRGCSCAAAPASSTSSSSPAEWPRLSFRVLKLSTSRNSTAVASSGRRRRSRACSTRSRNRARLARSVSGSWKAWWESWSCSTCCSVTSRVFSTMPLTVGSPSRLVNGGLGVAPAAVVDGASGTWPTPASRVGVRAHLGQQLQRRLAVVLVDQVARATCPPARRAGSPAPA